MAEITFTLPGQPVGKAKRFDPRTGRGFNDSLTRHYMDALGMMAKIAMKKQTGRLEPFDDAIGIIVEAYYEIPASWPKYKKIDAEAGTIFPTVVPDADNILKTIGDSLKGICWRDDALITQIAFRKRYAAKPRLYVRVYPVNGLREGH